MAVQLRDAKIRVEIDVDKAAEDVSSLEKRTEKQREEAEKDRRKARDADRKAKDIARRPKGSRLAGAGLTALAAGTMRALPFGAGLVAGAGIAVAELSDRLGPGAEAAINAFLERTTGLRMGDWEIVRTIADEWANIKQHLGAVGRAVGLTRAQIGSDVLSGGTADVQEVRSLFDLNRRMALFESRLERSKRIMQSGATGKALGEVVGEAIGSLGGDMVAPSGAQFRGGEGIIFRKSIQGSMHR